MTTYCGKVQETNVCKSKHKIKASYFRTKSTCYKCEKEYFKEMRSPSNQKTKMVASPYSKNEDDYGAILRPSLRELKLRNPLLPLVYEDCGELDILSQTFNP